MLKITVGDVELVRCVLEWRLLTLQQMGWLTGRNLDAIRKRLATLAHEGIVQALARPLDGAAGRPEKMFAVTESTLKWVSAQNHKARGTFDLPAPTMHRHTLLVNDVLTQLPQLSRAAPALSCRWHIPNPPACGNRGTGGNNKVFLIQGPEGSRPNQKEWVPDALFTIHHTTLGKTLLFYLEADCDTETLVSRSMQLSVHDKLLAYREHFRRQSYAPLAASWGVQLQGFRLLIVTTSQRRLEALSNLVRQTQGCEFAWLTTQQSITSAGLHAPVWRSGGQPVLASILGSQGGVAALAGARGDPCSNETL